MDETKAEDKEEDEKNISGKTDADKGNTVPRGRLAIYVQYQ